MTISAIVAVSRNNVIGRDNQLPWYLPADLKYFKKTTLNRHVVMGRKSFEAIGKPLPKRTNIVVTRDPFFIATGCIVVHSLDEAISIARNNGEEELFILGGGEIFRQSWPLLDRIYLTLVGAEVEGDVFFPEVDRGEWVEVSADAHLADEKNPFDHTFFIFEKKREATGFGD